MTGLEPVTQIPNYSVIIRATWERGAVQREALAELERRGLWLTLEQKQHAGLMRPSFIELGDQYENMMVARGFAEACDAR